VKKSGKPDESPVGEPRKTKLRGDPGIQPRQEPEDAVNRGDPGTHRESALGRRRFGATRKIDSRADERCEIRCAPKIPSPVKAGRHSDGATRKNVEKLHWYSEGTGQPEFSKASTAEGCESRGNSTIHCRHGLKMQEAGEPVTASEAQQEE